ESALTVRTSQTALRRRKSICGVSRTGDDQSQTRRSCTNDRQYVGQSSQRLTDALKPWRIAASRSSHICSSAMQRAVHRIVFTVGQTSRIHQLIQIGIVLHAQT